MADAGIGEAMLISAAVGAGTGALSNKKDPWTGALIGGGLGALGGAAGSALGAAGGAGAGEIGGAASGDLASVVPSASGDIVNGMQTAANPLLSSAAPTAFDATAGGITSLAPQAYSPAMTDAELSQAIGPLQNTSFNVADSTASTQGVTDAGGVQQSVSPQTDNTNLVDKFAQQGQQQYQNAVNNIPALQNAPSNQPADTGLNFGDVKKFMKDNPALVFGAGTLGIGSLLNQSNKKYGVPSGQTTYSGPANYFHYNPATYTPQYATSNPYQARYADGGIAQLQSPTPSMMSSGPANVDYMGGDMYPQSQIKRSYYATPSQMPTSAQQVMASYEPNTNPLTGEATANMAGGGIANLGGYSDGGQLLKGPGDGVSDSIPASIGNKQPARLADGEFVVPARIVSELGNGSTDAGAKQLYAMMDRVQKRRGQSTGKGKVAKNTRAYKELPA